VIGKLQQELISNLLCSCCVTVILLYLGEKQFKEGTKKSIWTYKDE